MPVPVSTQSRFIIAQLGINFTLFSCFCSAALKFCRFLATLPPGGRRPAAVVASASERDAKSDKGAELGMIRIKKVEEVRSESASPLWENEEGPGR